MAQISARNEGFLADTSYPSDRLEIRFHQNLETATQDLTLNVDGTAFAFEDADDPNPKTRSWNNSTLTRKIRGVFRFRYRHKSPRVVQVQC